MSADPAAVVEAAWLSCAERMALLREVPVENDLLQTHWRRFFLNTAQYLLQEDAILRRFGTHSLTSYVAEALAEHGVIELVLHNAFDDEYKGVRLMPKAKAVETWVALLLADE